MYWPGVEGEEDEGTGAAAEEEVAADDEGTAADDDEPARDVVVVLSTGQAYKYRVPDQSGTREKGAY